MPFTDSAGRVWPDVMEKDGTKLILDPVASLATKRPKYRADPVQRKEYEEKYGFSKKEKAAPGVGEGLGLAGAAATATVLGQQLGNYLGDKAANIGQSNPTPSPTPVPKVPPSGQNLQQPSMAPAPSQQLADAGAQAQLNPGQYQSPMSAQQQTALQAEPQPIPADASVQPDGTVVSSEGFPIGRAIQGAAGLYQVYSGVQQFQDGNKVGGALNVGTGALNVGAAAGSQTAAGYVPYANAALGAYNVYDAFNQDGLTAEQQASLAQHKAGMAFADAFSFGLATPVDNALRKTKFGKAITGPLDKLRDNSLGVKLVSQFGSSKGQNQVMRDQYRKSIIESGNPLFDANYQGTLADGSTFDFGKDKFGFGEGEGDFNLKDPTTAKAAAYGNVLAAIQGAQGKGREAIATQFLGASTANAGGDLNKVKANYGHFLNKLGVTDPVSAQAALDQAKPNMSEEEYQVFSSDLKELFSPAPPVRSPDLQKQQNGLASAAAAPQIKQGWMR